jgi:hypothetical protein
MNQNRILSIAVAALLATVTLACSGSPMATSPLAPSAVTATGFALETGDTADAMFGALGNDNDRGKGTDGTTATTPTPPTTTVEAEAEDDDGEDEDGDDEDRRGNPHHGAGPHSGTVSSFRGACPAVTFNLKGLRISTTEATTYAGGTCETLRPNVQVIVTGTAGTATRTSVAKTITITRTPNVRTR